VGEYHVLAAAFPSYNNPSVKNSTYSRPVPSQALPAPITGSKDKQYGCVMNCHDRRCVCFGQKVQNMDKQ
jgi:hypothetical protein